MELRFLAGIIKRLLPEALAARCRCPASGATLRIGTVDYASRPRFVRRFVRNAFFVPREDASASLPRGRPQRDAAPDRPGIGFVDMATRS